MTEKDLHVATPSKRFRIGSMDYTSTQGKNKGNVVKRYGIEEVIPDTYNGDRVVTWKTKFKGERIQFADKKEFQQFLAATVNAMNEPIKPAI